MDPNAVYWEEPWIHWEYEDQLPNTPQVNDLFRGLFRCSQIRDGVRMYPFIWIGDKRIFLVSIC
jgi:hypothetical protein